MRKVIAAIYWLIIIRFLLRLNEKFVFDGTEQVLWLNLKMQKLSLELYRSRNHALLNRIRDKMIDHEWNDDVLSIGTDPAYQRSFKLHDTELGRLYPHELQVEIQKLIDEVV